MAFKFSVLMSVYWGTVASELRLALDSVVGSSLPPDQICVVLDGKVKQDVEAILNDFSFRIEEFDLVRLPVNQGLGKALNEGLKYCKHEWVARFDSDDVCAPERFEKQIDFLKANPGVQLVGSWVAEFDQDYRQPKAVKRVPSFHDEIVRYSKVRNPFNHMSVMFDKSQVDLVGGYQDCYLYEDYDLWMRLLGVGTISANLKDVLIYARVGNGMSARRGGVKYAISELRAFLKFYRLNFIDFHHLLLCILFRLPVRILPSFVRQLFYNCFLR